jgi:hypothetical protein
VIFELSSFQETVDNQTTFDLTASNVGPIVEVGMSGNSTDCVAGPVFDFGPCVIFLTFPGILESSGGPVAAFSGPGTYTESQIGYSATVTITDISSVPEPSALVLLSSCLLGVGLVVRKRRCHQRA